MSDQASSGEENHPNNEGGPNDERREGSALIMRHGERGRI